MTSYVYRISSNLSLPLKSEEIQLNIFTKYIKASLPTSAYYLQMMNIKQCMNTQFFQVFGLTL